MSRMKKVALFMYMVFASSWILSGCNQVKIENKIEDKKEFFIDY